MYIDDKINDERGGGLDMMTKTGNDDEDGPDGVFIFFSILLNNLYQFFCIVS